VHKECALLLFPSIGCQFASVHLLVWRRTWDWWLPLLSNNLGLSLGHQIYNRSIFVKGISMAISLIFHCDFSIVCLSISLGYFNCMPGDFIVIFQLHARGFHWDISNVCLAISLGYFNCMPGYFIGIFQLYAWVFHCDF
jgi:hypothetical protein